MNHAGVNNVIRGEAAPATHLEWLVEWVHQAWPETRVAISGLLPHNWDNARTVGQANAQLRALAQRQGAAFIQCGQVSLI